MIARLEKILKSTAAAVALSLFLPASTDAGTRFNNKDAQIAASNMLIYGAAVGIKTKSWKGFLKGAASGAVVYGAKKIAVENNAPWAAYGLGVLGNSMAYNSITKQGLFDNIYAPLGFMEFRFEKNGGLGAKILPECAIQAGLMFADNSRHFEARKSLKHATLYFSGNDLAVGYSGRTTFNTILMNEGNILSKEHYNIVEGHEAVHLIQYGSAKFFSELYPLREKVEKLDKKTRIFETGYFFGATPLMPMDLLNRKYQPTEIEAEALDRDYIHYIYVNPESPPEE